jgi:hypothetical protein
MKATAQIRAAQERLAYSVASAARLRIDVRGRATSRPGYRTPAGTCVTRGSGSPPGTAFPGNLYLEADELPDTGDL